jgi:hypothetical protein
MVKVSQLMPSIQSLSPVAPLAVAVPSHASGALPTLSGASVGFAAHTP